jgi:hypothetical protein
MSAAPSRASRRLLIGAGLALGLPGIARAQPGLGRVEELRGEATAEAGARRRALAQAAPVFDGDLVATGEDARCTLRLAEALEIRLGGGVRLRIDRFLARSGGTLVLERGAMLLDRQQRGAAPPPGVTVRSPFGLIAVRGTRFFAGPSNGVFGVFVERGEVFLVGADQGVPVTPGFGADIAAPGAAPSTPARWGAPRIEAALASVR